MATVDELHRGSASWLPTALAGIGVAIIATRRRGPNPVDELEWRSHSPVGRRARPPAYRSKPSFEIQNEVDPTSDHGPGDRGSRFWNTDQPGRPHGSRSRDSGEELRIDQGPTWSGIPPGPLSGPCLIFCDVSERQRAVRGAEDARRLPKKSCRRSREPLVVLDAEPAGPDREPGLLPDVRSDRTGDGGAVTLRTGGPAVGHPRLRQLLEEVLPRDSSFSDFAVEREFEGIGRRSMVLDAPPHPGRQSTSQPDPAGHRGRDRAVA